MGDPGSGLLAAPSPISLGHPPPPAPPHHDDYLGRLHDEVTKPHKATLQGHVSPVREHSTVLAHHHHSGTATVRTTSPPLPPHACMLCIMWVASPHLPLAAPSSPQHVHIDMCNGRLPCAIVCVALRPMHRCTACSGRVHSAVCPPLTDGQAQAQVPHAQSPHALQQHNAPSLKHQPPAPHPRSCSQGRGCLGAGRQGYMCGRGHAARPGCGRRALLGRGGCSTGAPPCTPRPPPPPPGRT